MGTWWYSVAWKVAGTQTEGQRIVPLPRPMTTGAAVHAAQVEIAASVNNYTGAAGRPVTYNDIMLLHVIDLVDEHVTDEQMQQARDEEQERWRAEQAEAAEAAARQAAETPSGSLPVSE